ncbi:DarT1-associated NADAR antitoxin family protein [Vibrio parahaemolyticus]|uniref:DarT1-associated NADAR antitoxin family protein n=1 Tax=Vibrio parahaemolyticus TaxID=670 RepID=UPI0011C76B25|nr:hypothetical protein [Vibrio parahaemolyticus]EHW0655722.1 hypothetical protein [Vibrio parahaemolyticus]TXM29758.1 hypothetical protein FVP00_24460 [Vibrio parahaemolyticus]
MAIRPVFIPRLDAVGVEEKSIEFKWFPGYSASQKQKSIHELHSAALSFGCENILEISSKSSVELGIALSAFNLEIVTQKKQQAFTVESAFQGSKVFEQGGPYLDLFQKSARDAKKDIRLKESGNLTKFRFFNVDFPLIPRTYFYDWLYINALVKNEHLVSELSEYSSFTDIEFNPKKSINCQAHAVALYLSIQNQGLDRLIKDPVSFLKITSDHYASQKRNIAVQTTLL